MDWSMWRDISASGRSYLPLLRYGDYGIQPASALARVPRVVGGGPPWGYLRYTTDRSFVIAKTLARGDGHVAHNRAAARHFVELPDFRGPGASGGEAWLRDCAHGSGGVGTFGKWLSVGNVQHMAFAVRSL